MKLVTKIATIATLASFMFAGMNVTWGNNYSDDGGDLAGTNSFGFHLDVNEGTTIGWEGGLMLGLAGPAGTTFRLGMGSETDAGPDNDPATDADNFSVAVPTLGMSYTWWEGAGQGWATNLSTAIDFQMVDGANVDGPAGGDTEAGDFSITINLGFGF